MSATNINDPAGVAALLEQLKASAAWQELELSTSSGSGNHGALPSGEDDVGPIGLGPVEQGEEEAEGPQPVPGDILAPGQGATSVASLLSQLKPLSVQTPSNVGNIRAGPTPLPSKFTPSDTLEDRRNVSFRDALPLLSDLAKDDAFVSAMRKMKDDQDALERRLFADREAIYTKYHEKFAVANTKAQMIGIAVSQHEVDMMTDNFKKELRKFDLERVIPAWDGLVSRQQQDLEKLHVPAMFATAVREDRDRQQQVMQVLETIVGVTR